MNREPSARPSAERNLLFGVLAAQLKFISHDELISSLNTWLLDKSHVVADVLKAQQALDNDQLEQISAAVEAQLQQHAGDASACLAAVAANCDSDAARLLEMLKECLAAEDNPDTPLSDTRPSALEPSQAIGNYRLLRPLGEGGMGTVWMAQQEQPVRRQVALKVIKSGRDSRQFVKRFEAERQALALMDHPHIAKVLDAGTTESGQPYFVMDLVRGIPLTEYCDQHKLSLNARLELFVPVCSAVQHAHQKGIIHRDLKPSNVLVVLADGKPVPKVIDFGLAKALQHTSRLTDETLHTHIGQMVGTLQYMSPEQAEANAVDIDTRTDIYALGVMLYELLTGSTPLNLETIGNEGLITALETIRHSDPPRPSQRLSDTSGEILSGVSSRRRIEARKLQQVLRGELDWVVMKALEKDRTRRYDTASALADDIRRFLNGEAVEARPPSKRYLLGKYVRRNKGLVAALTAIVTLLVAGVFGTSYGMISARGQQRLAESAADKERIAKHQAEQRESQFRQGFELIATLFHDLNIKENVERTEPLEKTLAKRLVRASDQLDDDSLGDPWTVAYLQNQLGMALLSLGAYQDAAPLFEKAWRTQVAIQPDHINTLGTMDNIAVCYMLAGHPERALSLQLENFEITKAALGAEHPNTIKCMSNLTQAYSAAGKFEEAVSLCEKTVTLMKVQFGEDHPYTLVAMNNLASALQDARQLDRSVPLFEQTLELMKNQLGANHLDTLRCMNNLAVGYQYRGQLDKGLPLSKEAYELATAHLGPDHPLRLACMSNLGSVYRDVDEHEKAIEILEQVLQLLQAKLGPDHPQTLQTKLNLAVAYREAGQFDVGAPMHEATLLATKNKLGPDHPTTLRCKLLLAEGYRMAGQIDKAEPLLEELLEHASAKLGVDHPLTLGGCYVRASCHKASGQLKQAIALFEKTLRLSRDKLGSEHPDTLRAMAGLAAAYGETNQLHESIPILEEMLSHCEQQHGRSDERTIKALATLGAHYKRVGRTTEALPLLEEAYLARERFPAFADVHWDLLEAYLQVGEVDKGAELAHTMMDETRQNSPSNSPQLASQLSKLGRLLLSCGAAAEAESALREALTIQHVEQPDDWTTFETQSLLGEALFEVGKLAEAERHLIDGYKGIRLQQEEIPQDQRGTRLAAALDGLIRLAEAKQRPDIVSKLQARRSLLQDQLSSTNNVPPDAATEDE